MAFQVTLKPSGHTFQVEEGRRVLDAGLAAGIAMPYSCRAGTCRTCRGKIIEGKVEYGTNMVSDAYLPPEHRAMGLALLCSAVAQSDLVIELKELSLVGVKPRMVPCRVKQLQKPAADVAILDVKLPMNENFMYSPGQYIDFIMKDGKRRSYSIATAPNVEGVPDLQLHIRHTPGGAFTDYVFNGMKEREVLRFEGPLGTFYLREDSDKPIIMVASGTGFAPIKSIVEYALRRKIERPMTLYWGCRAKADLYMLDLPRQWAEENPGFKFIPVLSDAIPTDAWTGRTGFVHRAVMQDYPDLSGYQVYACGVPVMVDAARNDFSAKCGLPEDEFFADSFLTEADKAGAPA
ncbi:MAG: CDP-6-deoxy-delta-3,4-glucoseen reductase [Betaproteobacteria bacterium]|nr:CDP-6-deoxy-delta-3,4-glucoseen reductase [Betaproteobacteria bacterium]